MKYADRSIHRECRNNHHALIWILPAVIVSVFFTIKSSAAVSADGEALPALKIIAAGDVPFFEDDLDWAGLKKAVRGSIGYYQKLPEQKQFAMGEATYTAGHMLRSMQHFLAFIEKHPSRKMLNEFIHQYYHVYAYHEVDGINAVLFTGYYEPLLYGSLNRSNGFKYPVYACPDNLVVKEGKEPDIGRYDGNIVVPYYARAEINEMGPSELAATPIAWVNDPVALFFLHVQGSGKIRLDSGRMINVHYSGSNGHPYRSIGRYLIEQKKLPKETVSMQSIRRYLHDHPDETDTIFNYNPRYIFFETVEKGPVGCLNIELTPGRSVALDRQTAPAGTLVFAQTQKPELDPSGHISQWVRFSRFFLNQDTGSAIKGPGRADIFWGSGDYAELAAGYMKHPGKLYFLVLKPVK